MSKPPLLLFTYYRLVPTGQIGIFKRCTRLMRHLVDHFDVHLVNYGPLPVEDSLFSQVHPRIRVHEPPEDKLGEWLEQLMQELEPRAVVLGETPLRGSMRLSHRVASALGLWQIAIENYYGEFLQWFLPAQWPRIDRWLLLGLLADGQPGLSTERIEVVPPFVQFPADYGHHERDRICIMGYDKQTLLTGSQLIGRLPRKQPVDFFIAPQWRNYLHSQGLDLAHPRLTVHVLPTDEQLYASMSRSKLLLGKAGFQQVVESISLGAPVICQAAGGGLEDSLVPPYLKPLVRFVETEQHLDGFMVDVASWLMEPPMNRWSTLAEQIADPIAYAAGRMRELIGHAAAVVAS